MLRERSHDVASGADKILTIVIGVCVAICSVEAVSTGIYARERAWKAGATALCRLEVTDPVFIVTA